MTLEEEPIWGTMLFAFGCFTLPPMVVWVVAVWEEMHRLRKELRTMSAEGFPPPDPPTTDSQVP